VNLISKILPASNILLDHESSSKKRVFESAGLLFENNQQIARSTVLYSLFAREKLGSTGVGTGA
jgi:PTS IIA-like nitrogen-regulatory protein PtsN